MNIFKIYTLSSSEFPENIRYVGQTINTLNKRLIMHKHKSKKETNHRACWIRSVYKNGFEVLINEIDIVTEDDWAEKEIYYIKLFKSFGANLVNFSNGGESNMLGKKHSKETKEKMKISRAKRKMESFTEERKQNMRLGALKA